MSDQLITAVAAGITSSIMEADQDKKTVNKDTKWNAYKKWSEKPTTIAGVRGLGAGAILASLPHLANAYRKSKT